MTREEAKTVFLNRGYVEVDNGTYYSPDKWREACVVISEWLEQEPCEDAISRQAVLDLLEDTNNGWIINEVSQLPSVKPQEKIGHWIFEGNQCFSCSSCGRIYTQKAFESLKLHKDDPDFPNNCPNCGADMRGEQDG